MKSITHTIPIVWSNVRTPLYMFHSNSKRQSHKNDEIDCGTRDFIVFVKETYFICVSLNIWF